MLAVDDVDRHALALVAVARFDHHRQTELLGGGPGVFQVLHRPAARHRHAGGGEQALGEVLVLRDRLGHRAGGIDLGGPDAALLHAPAELHQAAFGGAAVGHATRQRGVDDRAGAGAEAHVLVDLAQLRHRRVGIDALAGQRGGDQLLRALEGQLADLLFGALDGDLVDALLRRRRGAREAHWQPARACSASAGRSSQRASGIARHRRPAAPAPLRAATRRRSSSASSWRMGARRLAATTIASIAVCRSQVGAAQRGCG